MSKPPRTTTVYQQHQHEAANAVCPPSVFDPVSPCGADLVQQQRRWFMRVAATLCLASSAIMIFDSTAGIGRSVLLRSFQLLHWGAWWLVLWLFVAEEPRHCEAMVRWGQHSALVSILGLCIASSGASAASALLGIGLGFFFAANHITPATSNQQQADGFLAFSVSPPPPAATRPLGFPTADQPLQSEELVALSRELQDAARMVIMMLEQFSPTGILTDTHELLSACSIAVPIASVAAIHSIAQQICYIGQRLVRQPAAADTVPPADPIHDATPTVFDIGDLVQNAADALAGMAAKLDVNLILYHTDNGMHHANVFGSPEPVRHALLTLIWNILEGCTPGACIELGLNVVPGSATSTTSPFLSEPQPLSVTVEVIHTASPAIPHILSHALLPRTTATEGLLASIGGQLHINALAENRMRYEILMDMNMSPSGNTPAAQRRLVFFDDATAPATNLSLRGASNGSGADRHAFSTDPTLADLAKFIDRLNGVKMVLHARERSVFARHLTGCLASWNADISHVPVGVLTVRDSDTDSDDNDGRPRQKHQQPVIPSPAIAEDKLHSVPPVFILIDDDIETLETKLCELHHQQQRRPPQPQPAAGAKGRCRKSTTAAIIHFTSLTNYKRLRDMVHAMMPLTGNMPRLVVVPKPAGPRRFLTALHTGWHDATVEPHFMPIATSPSSPLWMAAFGDQHYDHRHHNHRQPSAPPPQPMTATTPAITTAAAAAARARKDGYTTPGIVDAGRRRDAGTSSSVSPVPMAQDDDDGSGSGSGSGYFSALHGSHQQQPRLVSPADTHTNRRNNKASGGEGEHTKGGREKGTSSSPPPPPPPPSQQHPDFAENRRVLAQHNTDHQKGLPTSTLPPETPAETPDDHAAAAASTQQQEAQEDRHHQQHEDVAGARDAAAAGAGGAAHDPEKPSLINSMRRRRTVRLSKKLKTDRGSSSGAFANTVSPPIHVLIVEDNVINQTILSAWMRKHKIKFSVASNGQEAVERWKGGGYHLVLMDIQLPVMDGIEATKTIRSIEKEQRIGVLPSEQDMASSSSSPRLPADTAQQQPVPSFRSPVIIVALTASAKDSDRHAALAAGCNDFLTKPISLEWLEKKIIEWGCMQALIDFEGWRRWKRSSSSSKTSTPSKATAASGSSSARPSAAAQKEKATAAPSAKCVMTSIGDCCGREENPRSSRIAAETATEHHARHPRQGILLLGSAGLAGSTSPATMATKRQRVASSPSLQQQQQQQQPCLLLNRTMSMLAVGQRQLLEQQQPFVWPEPPHDPEQQHDDAASAGM